MYITLSEPGMPKAPKPCESDTDCLDTEACFMSVCQDPCEFTNACASTAKCQAKMHRPICTCPVGYEGNPAIKCSQSHPSKITTLIVKPELSLLYNIFPRCVHTLYSNATPIIQVF